MAMLINAGVIAFLAAIVLCSELETDKDEYCVYKGLKIKKGETVPAPIGECSKVTCIGTNPTSMSKLTCATFQLAPGSRCHKSPLDLSKPYPACCPRPVCDDEE